MLCQQCVGSWLWVLTVWPLQGCGYSPCGPCRVVEPSTSSDHWRGQTHWGACTPPQSGRLDWTGHSPALAYRGCGSSAYCEGTLQHRGFISLLWGYPTTQRVHKLTVRVPYNTEGTSAYCEGTLQHRGFINLLWGYPTTQRVHQLTVRVPYNTEGTSAYCEGTLQHRGYISLLWGYPTTQGARYISLLWAYPTTHYSCNLLILDLIVDCNLVAVTFNATTG